MVQTIIGGVINVVTGTATGMVVETVLLNNLPKVASKTGDVVLRIGVAGAGVVTSCVVGDFLEDKFNETVENIKVIKHELQVNKEKKKLKKVQKKMERELVTDQN